MRLMWGFVVLCVVAVAGVEAASLKASRFGGGDYVLVSDVAELYRLGRDLSQDREVAKYQVADRELSAQAERREIRINGVTHWLSVPVLYERGRLWLSALDVLTTVDPVLRQGRQPQPAKVKTIVLDPGHGGADHGAQGKRGVEKVLTLDLAKRVRGYLEAEGFKVYMTRTSDDTLELEERGQFAAKRGADLFVSLHYNSGGSAQGIETFCATPAGAVSTSSPFNGWVAARKELATDGNAFDTPNVYLAHCIQRSLIGVTEAADRGVRRARFVVLRDAPCPAVLVESGFLSNATEERLLLNPEYREKLAKAIVAGIVEYRAAVAR